MNNKKTIYFDNAATTKISDEVFEAMSPYIRENYGNASSIYTIGRQSASFIEHARDTVKTSLNASSASEIYFTSGGSESDNWAIKGIAENSNGKNHIISTEFEHHAVLHTLEHLKKQGFEITLLPVNENGIIKLSDLENAIRPETALVSIMWVNNEIGTIQPIAEVGEICRKRGVIFHTDAVQAVGNVEIDLQKQKIDLLSISGHKIHAPKGIGVLYIRKGIKIPNLIDGGAQERGKRAGTENLSGIAGLAKALEIAANKENIVQKNQKLLLFQKKIITAFSKIEKSKLNGDENLRVPFNVNFSFVGAEGEALLLHLDIKGIAASSGSACTSGSLDPSHVLISLGLPHEVAHGSLRITMSENTTEEEVDYLIEEVPKVIKYLRDMSPLWENITKEEK